MKPLVFDSSPLNHFARAGRLAVLERLTIGHRRVVPQAVLDEIRAGEAAHPLLADVRSATWLEMVPCDGLDELRTFLEYARVLGSGRSDLGEAAVLAWAEVHGAIAIIDERAGTREGRLRDVDVHGSLWLIVGAIRVGELSSDEAARLVDQLRDTDARLPCSGADLVDWAKQRGLL